MRKSRGESVWGGGEQENSAKRKTRGQSEWEDEMIMGRKARLHSREEGKRIEWGGRQEDKVRRMA